MFSMKKCGVFPYIWTYWKFARTLDHLHIHYQFWNCGNGDYSVHYTL